MYDNLKKYMDKKRLKVKEKEVVEKAKGFDKKTASDKWALVEKALRDLGYVE